MNVDLGYCSAKKIKVDKISEFTIDETVSCQLKDQSADMRQPSILLKDVLKVSTYNYACLHFSSSVARYYYIVRCVIEVNGLFRLDLREDVLTTYRDLIHSQSAFVARSDLHGTDVLTDDNLPMANEVVEDIIDMTNWNTGSETTLKNVTFSANRTYWDGDNCALVVFNNQRDGKYSWSDNVDSIDSNYLPIINASMYQGVDKMSCYATDIYTISYLVDKCWADDNLKSYIVSMVSFPFTLTSNTSHGAVQIYLGNEGIVDTNQQPVSAYVLAKAQSRYYVLSDFTIPAVTAFYDLEPYTMYEIFIPYYGWKELTPSLVNGCRIIVYYVVNFVDGSASVTIYNMTKHVPIFTDVCQLGTKITYASTNERENNDQRTALLTSTLLSVIGSALSTGIGVVTYNPLMVGMGVLGASKAIGNYVTTEKQIYDRAQVSYGSGLSALHASQEVQFKIKHRKPIMGANLAGAHSILKSLIGWPCMQRLTLTSGQGYTEVASINLDMSVTVYGNTIISPNDDEQNEIIALLKQGVIL